MLVVALPARVSVPALLKGGWNVASLRAVNVAPARLLNALAPMVPIFPDVHVVLPLLFRVVLSRVIGPAPSMNTPPLAKTWPPPLSVPAVQVKRPDNVIFPGTLSVPPVRSSVWMVEDRATESEPADRSSVSAQDRLRTESAAAEVCVTVKDPGRLMIARSPGPGT